MSFTSLGPAEFSVIDTGFLHYGGVGKEMFDSTKHLENTKVKRSNCISIILTGNAVNLKAFDKI